MFTLNSIKSSTTSCLFSKIPQKLCDSCSESCKRDRSTHNPARSQATENGCSVRRERRVQMISDAFVQPLSFSQLLFNRMQIHTSVIASLSLHTVGHHVTTWCISKRRFSHCPLPNRAQASRAVTHAHNTCMRTRRSALHHESSVDQVCHMWRHRSPARLRNNALRAQTILRRRHF